MDVNNIEVTEKLCLCTVAISFKQNLCGTGFFFNFGTENHNNIYLVTNKHVAILTNDLDKLILHLHIKQDEVYKKYSPTIYIQNKWIYHPNTDLAILPMNEILDDMIKTGKAPTYTYLCRENIPTDDEVKNFCCIENLLTIGYPGGYMVNDTGFPIARQGISATPLAQSFIAELEKIPIPDAFLIDIPIYGGASGSPVFTYNPSGYINKHGGFVSHTIPKFVGIASGFLYDLEITEKETIRTNNGLGIAIKSRRLLDFVELI